MALTKTTESSGKCIRDGRYTRSKVKANKQTKALEAVIGAPQVTLKQHIDARIAADDAAIDARAEQDAREEDLQDAQGALSAKLFGESGSYDSDVYRAVFEVSPSKIAVMAEDDRRKQYVKVNDAIAKGVPKACDPAAKAVLAAHGDYAKAYGNRENADKVLGDAEKLEGKARDNWHTAIRQLKAQLTNLFPRDPKKVLRFFPVAAKAKKKGPGDDEPK